MMMTRMSDDRDDHISRSKTNDPTRDARESRGKARARTTTTNDSPLVITLFLSYFLYSIYSLTKPLSIIESIFVFTFRVERNDDTQQGSRLSG